MRLLAFLLILFSSFPASAHLRIYSLGKADVRADERVFSNPNVQGLSIRTAWKNLEPAPGVYNWAFLDGEISRAQSAGMSVLLRVSVEGPAAPAWLLQVSQTITFSNAGLRWGGVEWLPWDQQGSALKRAMWCELGARYASNPAVKIIAVETACLHSGDWCVPHTRADIQQWLDAGYSTDRMIQAIESDIDMLAGAFPSQKLTLAVGRNGGLDPSPDYVAEAASNYAVAKYGRRFFIQKNSLSTKSPDPWNAAGTYFSIMLDFRHVAGQSLWFIYGDASYRQNGGTPGDPAAILQRTIDLANEYGMRWLEVYQTDVVHLLD